MMIAKAKRSLYAVERKVAPRLSAIPMMNPPTAAPITLPMPPRMMAPKPFTTM